MNSQNQSFYTLSIGINIIAIVLMVVTDYGGLYWYNGYYMSYNWIYINMFQSVEAALLLGSGVVILAFISLTSQKAIREKRDLLPDELEKAFRASQGLLAIVVIGFIAFLLNTSDVDDWWLDTGFYSSLVASLVNYYIFSTLKSQIN